jgi:hypothetical protein
MATTASCETTFMSRPQYGVERGADHTLFGARLEMPKGHILNRKIAEKT